MSRLVACFEFYSLVGRHLRARQYSSVSINEYVLAVLHRNSPEPERRMVSKPAGNELWAACNSLSVNACGCYRCALWRDRQRRAIRGDSRDAELVSRQLRIHDLPLTNRHVRRCSRYADYDDRNIGALEHNQIVIGEQVTYGSRQTAVDLVVRRSRQQNSRGGGQSIEINVLPMLSFQGESRIGSKLCRFSKPFPTGFSKAFPSGRPHKRNESGLSHLLLSRGEFGFEPPAIGLAIDHEVVGVGREAVDGALSADRIREGGEPLVRAAV
jgi:hypothetical protein